MYMHLCKHTWLAPRGFFQSHTWFCTSNVRGVICWDYSHIYSNLLLDTVRPLAVRGGWHCNSLLLWLPSISGPAPDPSATCNMYMYTIHTTFACIQASTPSNLLLLKLLFNPTPGSVHQIRICDLLGLLTHVLKLTLRHCLGSSSSRWLTLQIPTAAVAINLWPCSRSLCYM